jgi:hypothetical protein
MESAQNATITLISNLHMSQGKMSRYTNCIKSLNLNLLVLFFPIEIQDVEMID